MTCARQIRTTPLSAFTRCISYLFTIGDGLEDDPVHKIQYKADRERLNDLRKVEGTYRVRFLKEKYNV
jgi:hypothetical protein